MLDDLRNSSAFIDDEEPQEQQVAAVQLQRPARGRRKDTFLGMTAQQRFILSLFMFFMVCALGAMALYVTGSIALP